MIRKYTEKKRAKHNGKYKYGKREKSEKNNIIIEMADKIEEIMNKNDKKMKRT